ncbi:PQQ-dependent sugar dehydrogenase [Natrialbaceae archaeon A-CW1-1]
MPPSEPPHPIRRRTVLATGTSIGALSLAGCLSDLARLFDDRPPEAEGYEFETVVEDLSHPWGLEFVPDTDYVLITIRGGELLLADRENGSSEQIEGIPDVYASGQGGLLDVTLHPEYPEESWMYLTYSVENDEGESATAVGRGQFDPDADTLSLESFEEIHVAEAFVDSTGHFGSRVVFGPDEMIYVTTGDRQSKDFGPDHVSQDTTNELGATLRLEPDGSIPDDNPFVDDDDFEDSIFTYGHRNVQGMTVHPETDEIWQSEHGEEDGDEINVLEEGENYGWPIAHTGCEYNTDEPVGDDPHDRDDVVDPVYYWECTSGGFPPAGMTFYDGEAFPEWDGDLFVGNLAGQYLGRFTVDGTDVDEVESLLGGEGWRIRDVAVEPGTGYLYVLVDDDSSPLVRIVPE